MSNSLLSYSKGAEDCCHGMAINSRGGPTISLSWLALSFISCDFVGQSRIGEALAAAKYWNRPCLTPFSGVCYFGLVRLASISSRTG